jgi:hypothetical protein
LEIPMPEILERIVLAVAAVLFTLAIASVR